ncbi:hypothetical protein QQF64_019691 [Cirrhinus molitorella]|uniref:RRM domain-containing protein n=1 Tax=Cirrhinus molitorella TaxID=172907 RepID=A0ABR3LHJ8_9TELE
MYITRKKKHTSLAPPSSVRRDVQYVRERVRISALRHFRADPIQESNTRGQKHAIFTVEPCIATALWTVSVWVARNPPGFAFVEFEDPRDATDAVRELDGRTLCGCRVRVELSNGEKRSRNRGPPPSWSRRPRDDYRRRSPAPRRRSPRRRSLSRSRSRSLSRERRRERSLSRDRNHRLSRSFSRSRSRSRSNDRK